MSEERTKFDYLLNAYDTAGSHADPASQNFHEKRKALFAYVREMERVAMARSDAADRIDRLERRIQRLESLPTIEDSMAATGVLRSS